MIISRRNELFIELFTDGEVEDAMQKDTDITRDIRIIEFLKSELLTSLASLFNNLLKGSKANREALLDVTANIILVTYMLGKRLGFNHKAIDSKILDKIKIGRLEENEEEKWYGDLSELSDYIKKRN